MRFFRLFPAVALAAATALAQDRVTLANGDVLTGTIKSMADGKLVITNPSIGDVTVPFANIANLSTQAPVDLLTSEGERLKRRIAGIDAGQLKLDGGAAGAPAADSMAVANLLQINPAEVSKAWTGSFTVGATWSSGNTDRRSIGLALDAVQRGDSDRFTVDAAWDYAEDKKTDDPATAVDEFGWDLTERRAGAGLKYDRFISKKTYWLVATRVLGDTLADIQLRFSAGAGLGYQVIEEQATKLLVEAGLSYFSEEYRSATPTDDYLAARLSYELRRELSATTSLVHGVEAFPSTENADNVYFQMDTRLQTSLTASMIAQLGWIWDYDNTPAPGRDRSDHRVVLSVGWKF